MHGNEKEKETTNRKSTAVILDIQPDLIPVTAIQLHKTYLPTPTSVVLLCENVSSSPVE